jgi:hypothetical protein
LCDERKPGRKLEGLRSDIYLLWCRCRWKGSIKMDLTGIELEVLDYIFLVQNRGKLFAFVNTVNSGTSGSMKGSDYD